MSSREQMKPLEGSWTGTETVSEPDGRFEATARMSFQTVFDGRFMLCDYVQTRPEKQTSVAHGVFRLDERTNAFTVTWFRSPVATATQQTEAVTEDDTLTFHETVNGKKNRVKYIVGMDKLTVRMEVPTTGGEWKTIFEGAYRRR
ncbi:MAG TPA: DUF1579 family protein [Kofleriaceae bacterium]|jgi:hypothetical protein